MNKWIVLFLLWTPLFGGQEEVDKLLDGNARYVKGHVQPKSHTQKPFAVIVACADSRVAPEIIFDQGLGDLFVVRVAGNVVGELGMESIQYAINHLGVKLVMVLGHEYCGAVDAVKNHQTSGILGIAELIEPSIKGEKSLEGAIKANAQGVAAYLRTFLSVRVIAGYYDFESGKVEILGKL